MRRVPHVAILGLLAAAITGCGSAGASPETDAMAPSTPTAAQTTTAAPAAAKPARPKAKRLSTAIRVAGSRFGRILVARNGRTLYLFTADRTAKSTCYGACAAAWPPYTVKRK